MRRIHIYKKSRLLGAMMIVLAAVSAFTLCACSAQGNKSEQEEGGRPPEWEQDTGEQGSEETGDKEPEAQTYEAIPSSGDTELTNVLYRDGDTCFELYNYSEEQATLYAGCVNTAAEKLHGVNVYAMVVPTSVGITLPDGTQIPGSDQKAALDAIYGKINSTVYSVPLYDILMQHRTEYIYFRTDHHWTALGAYYAYQAFCKEADIQPHELTEYRQEAFEGFLGSFYRDMEDNPILGSHPDTVNVYHPLGENTTLRFYQSDGAAYDWQVIYPVEDYDASMKYSTFIGGDNPYTIIENPDIEDDTSCLVIKESFGNAAIPFLTDHYRTVHVIDYRYWTGNVAEFVRSNGVQNVVFMNNLSAIRSGYLMGKLSLLF